MDYTRVEVTLRSNERELTRVLEVSELAAYLHVSTRCGWICTSVEWTEKEVTK